MLNSTISFPLIAIDIPGVYVYKSRGRESEKRHDVNQDISSTERFLSHFFRFVCTRRKSIFLPSHM